MRQTADLPIPSPAQARKIWESMANPSTRRVATRLRQAGSHGADILSRHQSAAPEAKKFVAFPGGALKKMPLSRAGGGGGLGWVGAAGGSLVGGRPCLLVPSSPMLACNPLDRAVFECNGSRPSLRKPVITATSAPLTRG